MENWKWSVLGLKLKIHEGCGEIKDWGSWWYLVIKMCGRKWELMVGRRPGWLGFLVWVSEQEESVHLGRVELTPEFHLGCRRRRCPENRHICNWNLGEWSKCLFPNNFYLLFKSILLGWCFFWKNHKSWSSQSNVLINYYVLDTVGGIKCAKQSKHHPHHHEFSKSWIWRRES